MDQRHAIGSGIGDAGIVRRDAGGFTEIGTDLDGDVGAERQDTAVAVERQFGLGDLVPSMHVGGDAFAAVGGPLDRPLQVSGGPGDQHFLGKDVALHPEGAADIHRLHAHRQFGDVQHMRRHLADTPRVLAARDDCEAALDRIDIGDRRARLHGVGRGARIVDAQLRHVRRSGELLLDRSPLAEFELKAHIARRLVPDFLCVGRERVGQGHGG